MSRLRSLFGRLWPGRRRDPRPAAPARLIVGLGNPGPKYAATRHNVGFRVLERLAERAGVTWLDDPRLDARVATVTLGGRTCLLVAPQTMMNRSGRSVAAACARWPELDATTDLLIVYDDMDLPTGRLRLRPSGGGGGHRGIGDILDALDSKAVPRLRFGVGHPGASGGAVIDWVLAPFADDERATVEAGIERAADAVAYAVEHGVTAAMGQFNASD